MTTFIAAIDHSGGSTGGVLERYGQEYTEQNKMELVHAMRLRMVNHTAFTGNQISHAILYKDTVDRGMVPVLESKGIRAILKIDSGCAWDGSLKQFPVKQMCEYAVANDCVGTKMRSIVKSTSMVDLVVEQQFVLAGTIAEHGLIPIIEPEVPIDHPQKEEVEEKLRKSLIKHLKDFNKKCILKLTLPERPNLYRDLLLYNCVQKIVGLSGGYTTEEACRRLSMNADMSASFSRALSEGLYVHQTDDEFDQRLGQNIQDILEACR